MRWTMSSLLAVALFLLASAPVPSAANGNSAQDGPLLHEIETDFPAYALLDTVEIACTVTNTSTRPIACWASILPREWRSIKGMYR